VTSRVALTLSKTPPLEAVSYQKIDSSPAAASIETRLSCGNAESSPWPPSQTASHMSPAPSAHAAALHCCAPGLSYAAELRPYSATPSVAAVRICDALTLNDQLKVVLGPPPPPPPPPSPKKDELLLAAAPYQKKLPESTH